MSTHAMTAPVDIRDYFLSGDPKAFAKATCSYEVVLQNNTDFIISRKSAKTARELVVLISQGLFYFKDGKGGSIEEITLSKLKTYLRELKDDSIALDNVLWLPVLNKDTVGRLEKIISNETFVEMCRHNVLTGIKEPGWYAGFWGQNQKLFMKLHSIYPTISDNSTNKYRASLPIIFEIEKRYGYNEAMHFAEVMLQSGIQSYTSAIEMWNWNEHGRQENFDLKGFMQLLDEPYKLDLRRLIEYIFYDTYSQGIANVDTTFWKTYEDCLAMQIKIYGKVKEKYPKHLKTEHDIMALKVNTSEMVAKCEDFAGRFAEVAGFAYTGPKYSIVVPETPQQIADEGINLSHCVGGYVDRIINGDCHILFLRKSGFTDQSLVTLQLCKGRINQAEGDHRRRISDEERNFLKKWGLEKHVQIAV